MADSTSPPQLLSSNAQMAPETHVTVLSPEGEPGMIPASNLEAAKQRGFKQAVYATSDKGIGGYLPLESAPEALKRGFTIGQPKTSVEDNPLVNNRFTSASAFANKFLQEAMPSQQEIAEHPITSAVSQAVLGPYRAGKALLNIPKEAAQVTGAQIKAEAEAMPDQGIAGQAYKKVIAPMGQASANFLASQYEPQQIATLGAIRFLPTNTALLRTAHRAISGYFAAQMTKGAAEKAQAAYQAYQQGDTAGAVQHATGAALDLGMAGDIAYHSGVNAGTGEARADLAEATQPVRSAVAPAVRATAKAANTKLQPKAIGGLIGGLIGKHYGGPWGAVTGSSIGAALGDQFLPQVHLPGEGFDLPNRVTGGPETAPEFTPPPTVPEAQPPSPFANVPEPPPVPSFLRRQAGQQLENLLQQGLGAQPQERNAPIYPRRPAAPAGEATAPAPSPEGHTPVEASWIKSYKYNPETREFEMAPQDGTPVRLGDVSPEEAKAFADAKSKSREGWKAVSGNPVVAKFINGKWVPTKPSGRATAAGQATAEPTVDVSPFQSEGDLQRAGAAPAEEQKPAFNLPGFFLKSEQVAREKLPNAGPGDSMLATLRNNGVKEEEIRDLHLDQFAGKPKVTKQEFLNEIQSNQIWIKEITHGPRPEALGRAGLKQQRDAAYVEQTRLFQELQSMPREDRPPLMDWLHGTPEEKAAMLQQASPEIAAKLRRFDELGDTMTRLDTQINQVSGPEIPTRHERWALPGGTNYREMLLQLPVKPPKPRGHVVGSGQVQMRQNENGAWDVVSPDGRLIMGNLPHNAAQMVYERHGGKPVMMEPEGGFEHAHWNERNVLAHFRLTDRDTPDGKRTLMVEEAQSDPLQALREANEARAKGGNLTAQQSRDYERFKDLPFQKNWEEVLMKRVLRYAAENGYDRVAWTTGEQQVERYREYLRQRVDNVNWTKNADGSISFDATKNGRPVISQQRLTPDRLALNLGKDMANQIVNSKEAQGSISGGDLAVGGAGMREGYDVRIPSFLKRYTKKYGGRVGETQIGTGARLKYQVLDPDGQPYDAFSTQEAAQRAADDLNNQPSPITQGHIQRTGQQYTVRPDAGVNVHSIDITPEMKAQYMGEGQPLYRQAGGAGQRRSVMLGEIMMPATYMKTEYRPSETGERAGAIYIDDQAHNLLSLLRGNREWEGVSWSHDQALERAAWLRKTASQIEDVRRTTGAPSAGQNMLRLADQIEQAARDNGKAGVPIVYQGAGAEQVGIHEAAVHGGQRVLDPHGGIENFIDVQHAFNHPLQAQANLAMRMNGYPSNPANLVAEAQAHILDGGHRDLGLTPEQAAELMNHHWEALQRVHGEEGLANAPALAREYVRRMQEMRDAHARYTEANARANNLQLGGELPEVRGNLPAELGPPGSEAETGGLLQGTGATEAARRPAAELERRKAPPKPEESDAYSFVSPNVFEGMQQPAAKTRLRSATHEAFRDATDEIHQALGLDAKSTDAYGTWKDGAENSVVTRFTKPQSFDQVRYATALAAKLGNQKSAIAFQKLPEGPDTVAQFSIPLDEENNVGRIAKRLSNAGLEYHTIVPVTGGHTVVLFDQGTQLPYKVVEAAQRFGLKANQVRFEQGQGEFLGADTREDAQNEYDRVIADLEAKNPSLRGGGLREGIGLGRNVNRLRRAQAEAEKPVLEAEYTSPSAQERRASELSTKLTGDQPEGRYKYRAALNPENYYNLQADPQGFAKQAGSPQELQKLAKKAGYQGIYDPAAEKVTAFKPVGVKADFVSDHYKGLFEPGVLDELKTGDEQLKFLNNLKNLPGVKEVIQAAKQGVKGKLWYQRSADAFDSLTQVAPELFPASQKQKFVDFVAALSPQQPVPENIAMAISGWAKWMKAGQPTSIAEIRKLIPESEVDLEARLYNAHRALVGENISGYKVSDFTEALKGNLHKAVIDRIMATFFGLPENYSLQRPSNYFAVAARVKEAAQQLGWEPSEVQAAAWVWTEALLEQTGLRRGQLIESPEEVATKLTPDEVAKRQSARDVLDLLQHDDKVRSILGDNGVDIEKLDRSLAAAEVRRPKPAGEGAGIPSYLRRSAKRIAENRGKVPEEFEGSTDFPTGGDLESRPLRPIPNYPAFRTRSVGEQGIPYEPQGHAQATASEAQARGYIHSRGETMGEPQEVVNVDLSQVPGFSVEKRRGMPWWYKFHGAVPESALKRR